MANAVLVSPVKKLGEITIGAEIEWPVNDRTMRYLEVCWHWTDDRHGWQLGRWHAVKDRGSAHGVKGRGRSQVPESLWDAIRHTRPATIV